MVTDVPELEQTTSGDEVPVAEAPGAWSAAETSPWVGGTPPPRSMKRERSFISRAWMSSGLPCDSADASHLRKLPVSVFATCAEFLTSKDTKCRHVGHFSPRVTFPTVRMCLPREGCCLGLGVDQGRLDRGNIGGHWLKPHGRQGRGGRGG